MSEPRNRLHLLRAAPALALAALFASACGGGAKFATSPDRDQAETGWCDMLGKAIAGGEAWDKAGECKSAHPAASAAFLKAMTKCYASRLESYGKDAPDPGALVAECKDQVLLEIPPTDANTQGVIAARCAREARCESVTAADCKASFDKLEAAQRAMLTTMYDGPALEKIADCLSSAPCTDDQDEERCYASVSDRLVYYPR